MILHYTGSFYIKLFQFVWKTWVWRLFRDIKQQSKDLLKDNGNGYCMLLWLQKLMLQIGIRHILHQVIKWTDPIKIGFYCQVF